MAFLVTVKAAPDLACPCECGHRQGRHFADSMLRGRHACMVPLCECRRFLPAVQKEAKRG